MKIAFISSIHEPWGGSEELWYAAAKSALSSRHQIIVSSINCKKISPKTEELKKAGAQIFLRRGYIKPGTSIYLRVILKLNNLFLNKFLNPYRNIFRQTPDVIVFTGACYTMKDEKPLYNLLKKTDTPFFIINQVNYEYGKSITDQQAALIKKSYHRAKKVLFVSQRNLDIAKKHLLDPVENASIVRNPVNIPNVNFLPLPAESKIQMAIVANLLVNHKGHDILLEVLKNEKWKQRDWQLNIYGSGVDEKYIKSLVSFFDLNNKVRFFGYVNDIKDLWRQNHLLVLPSLCEGIPLALVEAMLCGRPSVVTDVGGNMEWVRNEVDGFIAESPSVNSFDLALEKAWVRRKEWAKIGEQAHNRAISLYDPDAGKTLLSIITSI